MRRAGAEVLDQEVVIDRQLTTSRSPADLPAFCAAIVEQFAKAAHRLVGAQRFDVDEFVRRVGERARVDLSPHSVMSPPSSPH